MGQWRINSNIKGEESARLKPLALLTRRPVNTNQTSSATSIKFQVLKTCKENHPIASTKKMARGSTSSRLTQLRSRLPRHVPRTLNRERNLVFPPNMDLDMVNERFHILETLEAFNDMGMAGNFPQV
ncbi:hypothetical protein CsSME_00023476 [Camellia sinensis var. sinensis]